jgi:predicted transcriptional regulator of viral defense system
MRVVIFIQMNQDTVRHALGVFRAHGGTLRTRDALAQGVHPRTLYGLRDRDIVEQVSRGVYRLARLPAMAHPDLVTVALRVPTAVVCLVSALAYHDLTSEIPHAVYIALPRGSKVPVLEHPPLWVFRFSGAPLTDGVQSVKLDGVRVRIYTAAKTVADCFRFRNRIGIGVAIEALNRCLDAGKAKPVELLRFARICRVDRIMMPYLEARQ